MNMLKLFVIKFRSMRWDQSSEECAGLVKHDRNPLNHPRDRGIASVWNELQITLLLIMGYHQRCYWKITTCVAQTLTNQHRSYCKEPIQQQLLGSKNVQDCTLASAIIGLFFFLRFYLRIWERERALAHESRGKGKGTGRGRSRLPAEQRASCGAWSQNPEIMTGAEGRGLTNWATWVPWYCMF